MDDKYERLGVIGHGASGVVHLAKDRLLGRIVALKEIRAPAPETERVLNEARLLDRLRHPNIVAVHGVDLSHGIVLIAMEWVPGKNLSERLKDFHGSPLPVGEALYIALAVLDALAYAHDRRIVHRDIKPANILLSENGAVKLTDFGLAEALGAGSIVGGGGTYPYMAPEDFSGESASDRRSDLWAMGVVLYEMLTGQRPFAVANNKDPFAWKQAIETQIPPSITSLHPQLPAALDTLLQRALAKDKSARFQSASEFADHLRSATASIIPIVPKMTTILPTYDEPPTVAAPPALPVIVPPIAAPTPNKAQKKAKSPNTVIDIDQSGIAQTRMRPWYWPLLLLCLAPPAIALLLPQSPQTSGQLVNPMGAWAASGILSALLFLVCVGARLPGWARLLSLVPVGFGLAAAGSLARTVLGIARTPDSAMRLGAVIFLPVIALLLASLTAQRAWRFWAFLLAGAAFAVAARFAGFTVPR